MNKKDLFNKVKEGVSVQEVEDFARKYAVEVFSVIAVVVAGLSSMFDFFTGAGFSILFATIGVILGVFCSVPADRLLRQFYAFAFKQEKTTQIVLGVMKIIIAIFIPFILFGLVGLLAGTAYHYYAYHYQSEQPSKMNKIPRNHSGEEHD
jgi:hypothetical protein